MQCSLEIKPGGIRTHERKRTAEKNPGVFTRVCKKMYTAGKGGLYVTIDGLEGKNELGGHRKGNKTKTGAVRLEEGQEIRLGGEVGGGVKCR